MKITILNLIKYSVLIVIGCVVGFYYPKQQTPPVNQQEYDVNTTDLKLAKEYFENESIVSIQSDDFSGNATTELEIIGAPYLPVKIFYDNTVRILSDPEAAEDVLSGNLAKEQKQQSIEQFGDLALRFMSKQSDNYILNVRSFDTNLDGVPEEIITEVFAGASSPVVYEHVVKNDQILFTAKGEQPTIEEAPNNNGFYVRSRNAYKWNTGEFLTRFVYQNGVFVPAFEQEISYVLVEDGTDPGSARSRRSGAGPVK